MRSASSTSAPITSQAPIATPAAESALHRRVFEEFRAQLTQRQPGMGVEGGLMALDGSIEMFD